MAQAVGRAAMGCRTVRLNAICLPAALRFNRPVAGEEIARPSRKPSQRTIPVGAGTELAFARRFRAACAISACLRRDPRRVGATPRRNGVEQKRTPGQADPGRGPPNSYVPSGEAGLMAVKCARGDHSGLLPLIWRFRGIGQKPQVDARAAGLTAFPALARAPLPPQKAPRPNRALQAGCAFGRHFAVSSHGPAALSLTDGRRRMFPTTRLSSA